MLTNNALESQHCDHPLPSLAQVGVLHNDDIVVTNSAIIEQACANDVRRAKTAAPSAMSRRAERARRQDGIDAGGWRLRTW